MKKDFCDRCGELVPTGKEKSSEHVRIIEDEPKKRHPEWCVGFSVSKQSWETLCVPCFDELVDKAYGGLTIRRGADDAFSPKKLT